MPKVSAGWGDAWAWGGNPAGGRKFRHNQPYLHRKGGKTVAGGRRTFESPELGNSLALLGWGNTGPRKRLSLTSMDPRTYRLKLIKRRHKKGSR